MLFRIIVLTLLIAVALAANCSVACGTCRQTDNPYSCLSCLPDNKFIFIYSCPQPSS